MEIILILFKPQQIYYKILQTNFQVLPAKGLPCSHETKFTFAFFKKIIPLLFLSNLYKYSTINVLLYYGLQISTKLTESYSNFKWYKIEKNTKKWRWIRTSGKGDHNVSVPYFKGRTSISKGTPLFQRANLSTLACKTSNLGGLGAFPQGIFDSEIEFSTLLPYNI